MSVLMSWALAVLLTSQLALAAPSSMNSRWGHASVYLPQPPSLLIQGGRVDPDNAYSYGSAPTSPDTILLPLSNPFPASAPPYTLLSPDTSAPAQTWHCLANLGQVNGRWQVLSFGGDGGWSQSHSNLADSAWLIDIDPATKWVNFTHQPVGWAGQPTRRMQHSCAGPVGGGTVYITGGRAVDGSDNYNEVYAFSPAANLFSELPPLPNPIAQHSSVLLANGTLLVFGGVLPETNRLLPASVLYTLDTTKEGATWQTLVTSGQSMPMPRLAASASLSADGKIFVFGGTDVTHAQAYSDGWILDPATLQWSPSLSTGAKDGIFDHSASEVGGQIVVVGGYGEGTPAPPAVEVIQTASTGSGSIVPTFSLGQGVATPTTAPNGIPPAATGTSHVTGTGGTGGTGSTGVNSGTPTTDTVSSPDGSATNGATSKPSDSNLEHSKDKRQTIILVCILAGVVLFIAFLIGLWFCLKKRDKKAANRPYSEKDEGAARLMDDEARVGEPAPTVPPKKTLAFAALGNGLSRAVTVIRNVSGAGSDGYRSLSNEAPKRRSTKRTFGRGIRLVRNSGNPLPPLPTEFTNPRSPPVISGPYQYLETRAPPTYDDAAVSRGTRQTWATASAVLAANTSPQTTYHDLDTSPPAANLHLPPAVAEEVPSHLNVSRDKHYSLYGSMTSADSSRRESRQSADIGTYGRDSLSLRRFTTDGTTLSKPPDISLAPLPSPAEDGSLNSALLASSTSSMYEVHSAVIGSAQKARSSTASLSFSTPRALGGVQLVASPSSGTGPSPASRAVMQQPLPEWPLRSVSSSTVSSTETSLPHPSEARADNPSVVSLASLHSVRQSQVVKQCSFTSTEGEIFPPPALRVEPQDTGPSTIASFVTANEQPERGPSPLRRGEPEEQHNTPGTAVLLAGVSRRPNIGLGQPSAKPLPHLPPPRSPSPGDPFLDTFSIDFGPTPQAASGLSSPGLLRPESPVARVSSPLHSTFGHKSTRSVDVDAKSTSGDTDTTVGLAAEAEARSSPSPMPKQPVAVLSPAPAQPVVAVVSPAHSSPSPMPKQPVAVLSPAPAQASPSPQPRQSTMVSPSVQPRQPTALSPSPQPRQPFAISPPPPRPTPPPQGMGDIDIDDDDILPVLRRFVSPTASPIRTASPSVTPTPSARNTPRRPVREIAASINRRTRAASLSFDIDEMEQQDVRRETARRVSNANRKSTPPGFI